MKIFRGLIVAGVMAMGFAGVAEAVPVQYVDTYTPTAGVTLSGNGGSYSYQHDITYPTAATNNLVATIGGVVTAGAGYDALTDILSSAVLTLYFTGTGSYTNGKFDLFLDGTKEGGFNFAQSIVINDSQFDIGLITNDGLLSVQIMRTNGSGTATFLKSVLNVSGERNANNGPDPQEEVPAPASLMLLGLGLVALGARRRKAA
ncbi:PEP-CTERM sorting domain-containing protein [Govanella unica]|uniref:PEP-CTERM sorting domain-containing protein n=1 Tax=Govanella unica TaxID=2975056 RepID=A0A9X3Z6H3_9PROT|nr:PEP-CTERM sorting domain-containing protein [Govania unica]MDA5193126.1 PEP-CTERM sorting domain-containing protein [Govania unica]